MLGKYIKINNTLMPNPTSFSMAYPPDENVFTSEAGTQLSNIRRLDRLTFSASFNCTDRMRDTLIGYCQTPSVTVQIDNGTATDGRLRLGDIGLVEDSEMVNGTQGLWTVSVTFEGE